MIPSLGRAQLLRILREQGSAAAELCGYEGQATGRQVHRLELGALGEQLQADDGEAPASSTRASVPVEERARRKPQARLLQVVEAKHVDDEPVLVAKTDLNPPWEDPNRGDVLALPEPDPLVPWPRLWRRLRPHLSQELVTREIDVERLIERAARADPLRLLPRLTRLRFAARPRILIDRSRRLIPFWSDQDLVCKALERWLLADSDKPFCLVDGSDPVATVQSSQFRLDGSLTGRIVLLLGDLGAYGTARDIEAWRRAGFRLKEAGATLRALCPCPSWRLDPKLAELWNAQIWDERERSLVPLSEAEQLARAEQLLTTVAYALRIEPGLLRQARSLLPANATDSSTEADVLKHPAVVGKSSVALTLDPTEQARLRAEFAQEPLDTQRKFIKEILSNWHAQLPPEILRIEKAFVECLVPGAAEDGRDCLKDVLLRAANAIYEIDAVHGKLPEGVLAWARDTTLRLPEVAWQDPELSEPLLRAWAIAYRGYSPEEYPSGIGPEILALQTRDQAQVPRRYRIWQVGGGFVVLPIAEPHLGGPPQPRHGTDALAVGSPVAEIVAAAPELHLCASGEPGTSHQIPTEPGETIPFPIAGFPGNEMVLTSDRQQLTIDVIEKPNWAKCVGRDEFGLYAEFELLGITQRMRWIAPGKFLMGSPEDEKERWAEGERQHEVELTEGYWMADTACTQELWQVVMGSNPSHFKGDQTAKQPVDRVSWDDCQEFVKRVNAEAPQLALRLPTEAEWEYACRAGTTTPFSFGESITTEQVNYKGKYPYAGGAKGENREKTVLVGSLPPNPWGLHEMHGNVYEWCEDWFAAFSNESATDPRGPDNGEHRVLRGGSWHNLAWFTRSAYRDHGEPGFRSDFIGFRFVRGRTEEDQSSGAREPTRNETRTGAERQTVTPKSEAPERHRDGEYRAVRDAERSRSGSTGSPENRNRGGQTKEEVDVGQVEKRGRWARLFGAKSKPDKSEE